MKTVKELIRKYLIHCAETSMHSPSRAGNYQEDMRKLKSSVKNHKTFKRTLVIAAITISAFITALSTTHLNTYADDSVSENDIPVNSVTQPFSRQIASFGVTDYNAGACYGFPETITASGSLIYGSGYSISWYSLSLTHSYPSVYTLNYSSVNNGTSITIYWTATAKYSYISPSTQSGSYTIYAGFEY